jgi:shikimate kinase
MNPGEPLPKNIILVGFMGCGKSTIGRKLEQLLGYPLVDTDQLIEEKTGTGVAEIFEKRGENYFRELEAAVLHELAAPDSPRRIISTGGGIVTRKRNRSLIKQLGYVVWLQAPVDVILERTGRNRDRPLLHTENPREKIDTLLTQRKPMYAASADIEVETVGLDAEEIACGILESARYHFAKP